MPILLLLLHLTMWPVQATPSPTAIIIDTDIAPDFDDVGALAMLHAFADKGEARLLATISSNACETTVPTLSVINTYFGRPDLPIGVLKAPEPNKPCTYSWAEEIISLYPHALRSNDEAPDAVRVYRKILASQPDTSVVIVTVGFMSNLANLLKSAPDEHSPLDGIQLVRRKVRRLVSMAGGIDSTGTGGYEYNITTDIAASKKVFADWPTEITLSGFEIGVEIFTGIRLISNDAIQRSPVKDVYFTALTYNKSTLGHYSWDQTAVLVAVRSIEPYFGFRRMDLGILDDGRDTVLAGDRITYLTSRGNPAEVARVIEDLMMHQPSSPTNPR
ncbi:MAG: nucleoside hydrolase [Bacteroidetes bacterium]|nr:nucleoside hydrolase [Bacteroidota bacterium]